MNVLNCFSRDVNAPGPWNMGANYEKRPPAKGRLGIPAIKFFARKPSSTNLTPISSQEIEFNLSFSKHFIVVCVLSIFFYSSKKLINNKLLLLPPVYNHQIPKKF